GAFIGPNLRTVDISAVKSNRLPFLGEATVLQLRFEAFNVFNRANFAPPELRAFTPSFGRIRSTVTSSRQLQLGLRLSF
ncbi:MAG TPA: hypothetical protein VF064_02295, partial [Pyrinomonadaceae bacterium]